MLLTYEIFCIFAAFGHLMYVPSNEANILIMFMKLKCAELAGIPNRSPTAKNDSAFANIHTVNATCFSKGINKYWLSICSPMTVVSSYKL